MSPFKDMMALPVGKLLHSFDMKHFSAGELRECLCNPIHVCKAFSQVYIHSWRPWHTRQLHHVQNNVPHNCHNTTKHTRYFTHNFHTFLCHTWQCRQPPQCYMLKTTGLTRGLVHQLQQSWNDEKPHQNIQKKINSQKNKKPLLETENMPQPCQVSRITHESHAFSVNCAFPPA